MSTTTLPDQERWLDVLDVPTQRRRLLQRLLLLWGVTASAAVVLEQQQLPLDRPPEPRGGGFAIGVSAIGGADGIGGAWPSLPDRVADVPS